MACPPHHLSLGDTWQVRSGGPELALELERDGYAFLGEGVEYTDAEGNQAQT